MQGLPRLVPVLAALLLTLGSAAQAATREGSDPVQVIALAVAEDSTGTFIGVHATVEAQVLSGGSGHVFVATKPLAQTDMQGSARLASRVAAATLGATWDQYDYLVSFRSDSTVIGGPSAGAVMTLALTTALHNVLHPESAWVLDPGVAGTGTINPDGTIGPVGGIPAKAEGAKEAGITTFLYPAGLDNATTQVNGRTVSVNMQKHCADLALHCAPAASLIDVLRAAGVDISQPAAPVPDTTNYKEKLEPTVTAQVQQLQARLDALANDARVAKLASADRTRVGQERGIADERLASAREALTTGKFYLAATRAFQGAIQVGRAENLTAFYSASTQAQKDAVVQAAIAGCGTAVARAESDADALRASSQNALYAIGSAQERTAQARDLRDQAQTLHDNARALEDWVQSLFASTFCVERAGTASWWADLRATFGAGPALTDRSALLDDTLETASEEVAYAEAVLGATAVQDAADHLSQAQAQATAGRTDAAVLEAVEAQTSASVAMMTAGGSPVPPAVLDAAIQSASRAIDTARSDGVEPMLSVSLVELSQDQNQTSQALANLWSARSLALLDRSPAPATVGAGHSAIGPYSQDTLGASLVLGAMVGGCLVVAILVVVMLVRRL